MDGVVSSFIMSHLKMVKPVKMRLKKSKSQSVKHNNLNMNLSMKLDNYASTKNNNNKGSDKGSDKGSGLDSLIEIESVLTPRRGSRRIAQGASTSKVHLACLSLYIF
jgi:hypothetical protein